MLNRLFAMLEAGKWRAALIVLFRILYKFLKALRGHPRILAAY